jgi:hypothetical protein
MKKIIRLTESDLTRIVKRVVKESNFDMDDDFEQDMRKYDEYHEDFYYNLDFDFDGAFGDDFNAESAFMEELDDYIGYMSSVNTPIERAISKLKKEPFIRKYRRFLGK